MLSKVCYIWCPYIKLYFPLPPPLYIILFLSLSPKHIIKCVLLCFFSFKDFALYGKKSSHSSFLEVLIRKMRSRSYIYSNVQNLSAGTSIDETLRPVQVFNDYPDYQSQHIVSSPSTSSIAPSLPTGIAVQSTVASSRSAAAPIKRTHTESETTLADLYGPLPPHKRRKFILVNDELRHGLPAPIDNSASNNDDDNNRNGDSTGISVSISRPKTRVRVQLERINLRDIPDSYRRLHSVFPRCYFPQQSRDESGCLDARFFPDPSQINTVDEIGDADAESDEIDIGNNTAASALALALTAANDNENENEGERICISKIMVPIPLLEGARLAIPRLSNAKKRRERILNDIGYRMLWSGGRKFDGRLVFLQKSSKYCIIFLNPHPPSKPFHLQCNISCRSLHKHTHTHTDTDADAEILFATARVLQWISSVQKHVSA